MVSATGSVSAGGKVPRQPRFNVQPWPYDFAGDAMLNFSNWRFIETQRRTPAHGSLSVRTSHRKQRPFNNLRLWAATLRTGVGRGRSSRAGTVVRPTPANLWSSAVIALRTVIDGRHWRTDRLDSTTSQKSLASSTACEAG